MGGQLLFRGAHEAAKAMQRMSFFFVETNPSAEQESNKLGNFTLLEAQFCFVLMARHTQ